MLEGRAKQLSLPQDPAGAGEKSLPVYDAKRQARSAMSTDQAPANHLRDAGGSATREQCM